MTNYSITISHLSELFPDSSPVSLSSSVLTSSYTSFTTFMFAYYSSSDNISFTSKFLLEQLDEELCQAISSEVSDSHFPIQCNHTPEIRWRQSSILQTTLANNFVKGTSTLVLLGNPVCPSLSYYMLQWLFNMSVNKLEQLIHVSINYFAICVAGLKRLNYIFQMWFGKIQDLICWKKHPGLS